MPLCEATKYLFGIDSEHVGIVATKFDELNLKFEPISKQDLYDDFRSAAKERRALCWHKFEFPLKLINVVLKIPQRVVESVHVAQYISKEYEYNCIEIVLNKFTLILAANHASTETKIKNMGRH